MTGGRYITCFSDDESRILRSFLYKLENLGIVKLSREKEKNLYKHEWNLTKKGKKIVDNDKNLQKLLEEKKIPEFYKKVINLLEKD